MTEEKKLTCLPASFLQLQATSEAVTEAAKSLINFDATTPDSDLSAELTQLDAALAELQQARILLFQRWLHIYVNSTRLYTDEQIEAAKPKAAYAFYKNQSLSTKS